MFERIDIMESIYKGVLKPYYKQYTRSDSTCAGNSSKNRGEAASSHTYSAMSEISGKRRNIYVDLPKGDSKTCLTHGPGHLLD